MDKLKQLEDIAKILDRETVTQEEFVSMFGVLIDMVGQIKEGNDMSQEEMDKMMNDCTKRINEIQQRVSTLKDGENYVLTSQDKKEIAGMINVPVVEKIIQHTETIKEQPIITQVALKDTPEETTDKINASSKKIQNDRIEGWADLDRIVKNNQIGGSLPITTSFFNGIRAKNLNIVGGTAKLSGDTVNVTVSGSGGGVSSIIAGTGISIDQSTGDVTITATGGGGATIEYMVASSTAPASTQALADYVCDGTADDVQINAALTALASASSTGGRVTLSEGTFNISASIVMKDYQILCGQGYGTILKAIASFNSDVITTVQTSDTSRRGLQVLSLKIDGNRDNNTSGRGIYGFNVRNSTFRDLWITECDEECINLYGGASEIGWLNTIVANQFDESDAGLKFEKCEHNLIQGNFFSHIDGVAVSCWSDMDFILDNFFDAIVGFGIYLDFGAGQWKIRGNSFERMDSHVIVCRGNPYNTITDNYIEVSTNMVGIYNGQFASGTDGCNYMVITNNTFKKRDGTATGTSGIVEGDFSDRCIYSNNFLYEMATPISANASSTNLIEINNQVS
jgi:hypothetical protein